MVKDKFESELLTRKKAHFLSAVKNAVKSIDADSPKVNFWEDECPYGEGNDWAHCHPDTNQICVSEKKLRLMDFDDIFETATHEVAHILEPNHDSSFHIQHDHIKKSSWKPYGRATIDPRTYDMIPKSEPVKEDKIHCNYHLCRKEAKLFQCKYCKGYFCSNHNAPNLPAMRDFRHSKTTYYGDRETKKGTHPCASYADHTLSESSQSDSYGEALKKWLGRKKEPSKIKVEEEPELPQEKAEVVNPSKTTLQFYKLNDSIRHLLAELKTIQKLKRSWFIIHDFPKYNQTRKIYFLDLLNLIKERFSTLSSNDSIEQVKKKISQLIKILGGMCAQSGEEKSIIEKKIIDWIDSIEKIDDWVKSLNLDKNFQDSLSFYTKKYPPKVTTSSESHTHTKEPVFVKNPHSNQSKPINEIYSNDYKHSDIDKTRSKKMTQYMVFGALIVLLLFLAFGSVSSTSYVERVTNKTITENITIPSKIVFDDYLKDPYKYEGQSIILKGYLMRFIEGGSNGGAYIESIKDDEGDYIAFSYMPRDYQGLFPRVGETDNLYEVNGKFKRNYKTLLIEVSSIKETERDADGYKELVRTINYVENVPVTNKTKVYRVILNKFSASKLSPNINLSRQQDSLKNGFSGLKEKTGGIVKRIISASDNAVTQISETLEEMDSPSINETEIENQIFSQVNEERRRVGVPPLIRNSYLDSLAKKHSERMITENFFEHSGDNVGENIFYNPIHYNVEGCGATYTNSQQATCMVEGWIDSPGHYANMIDYSYVSTGIGVSCSLSECKSTQNFR